MKTAKIERNGMTMRRKEGWEYNSFRGFCSALLSLKSNELKLPGL